MTINNAVIIRAVREYMVLFYHMLSWFSAHKYTATVGAAVLFFIMVAALVAYRSPAPLATNGITGTIQSIGGGSPPQEAVSEPVSDAQSTGANSFGGTDATITVSGPSADEQKKSDVALSALNNNTDADLKNLFATLTSINKKSGTTTQIYNPFSAIPLGLISLDSAPPEQSISAEQRELRRYGNEVGSYIDTYQQLHNDDAVILQNYFNDPQNSAKQAAVKNIAQAIQGIGLQMQQMSTVPASVSSLHAALAKSYVDAGANLSALVGVQGNDALVSAINSYHSKVGIYAQKYAAVALFFSLNHVQFQKNESGSVFMFSQ